MPRYFTRANGVHDAFHRVNILPLKLCDASGTSVIRIFLADGTYKNVRVDTHTTVKRIVEVVLEALGVDRLSFARFALRLNACTALTSGAHSDDCHWLHPTLRYAQLTTRYLKKGNNSRESDGSNGSGGSSSSSGNSSSNGVERRDCTSPQLRFELRIRFLDGDVFEMYQTEMAAFLYLYEQLTTDYLRHVAWKISMAKALEMAALMLRKRFPNLNSRNVEKRLDFSVVEREGGFARYLPETLVINTKRKHLQKTLVAEVRRVASLTEVECVFRFMRHLADVTPFNIEVFRASFGSKWQNPVDIHVGPDNDVAYLCENTRASVKVQLIRLTALRDISALCVRRVDMRATSMALVELRLLADVMPMTFTLPTVNIAESFAHLIDGYRMLIVGKKEAATVSTLERDACNLEGGDAKLLSPLLLNCGALMPSDMNAHNAAIVSPHVMADIPAARDVLENIVGRQKRRSLSSDAAAVRALSASLDALVHQASIVEKVFNDDKIITKSIDNDHWSLDQGAADIDMRNLRLEKLLGEGQFGNVYSALYRLSSGIIMPVAVKVCKVIDDAMTACVVNKYLLDEARVIAQFHHHHIIALLGVGTRSSATTSTPTLFVWLIMELAAGGELRSFLQREHASLSVSQLTTFVRQLADALSYMHEHCYVHGDVAARNCLVAHPRCLKLSDFGLSRRLDNQNDIYTAPHGKLPIKWLPPESINHRAFSTASDVFMFGVCAWEIFAFGVKPWQGIRNYEVIVRVERGERLRKPEICPEAVYALLMACWSAAPTRRPLMPDTLDFLGNVSAQLESGVSSSQINVPIFQLSSKNNTSNFNNGGLKPSAQTKSDVNFLQIQNDGIRSKAINPLTKRRRSSSASAPCAGAIIQTLDISSSMADDLENSRNSLNRLLVAQRVEGAADDRWLKEEEERRCLVSAQELNCTRNKSQSAASSSENSRIVNNNSHLANSSESLSISSAINNSKSERHEECSGSEASWRTSSPYETVSLSDGGRHVDDALFHALVQLIGAIAALSKRYKVKMPNDEFIDSIQEIQEKCREVLSQSDAIFDVLACSADDRRCITLVRRLVASDECKLKRAVDRVSEHANDTETYTRNFHRVDALRHAHAMAVDGKSLLEAVDAARANTLACGDSSAEASL